MKYLFFVYFAFKTGNGIKVIDTKSGDCPKGIAMQFGKSQANSQDRSNISESFSY